MKEKKKERHSEREQQDNKAMNQQRDQETAAMLRAQAWGERRRLPEMVNAQSSRRVTGGQHVKAEWQMFDLQLPKAIVQRPHFKQVTARTQPPGPCANGRGPSAL